jgi:hypothetical protein
MIRVRVRRRIIAFYRVMHYVCCLRSGKVANPQVPHPLLGHRPPEMTTDVVEPATVPQNRLLAITLQWDSRMPILLVMGAWNPTFRRPYALGSLPRRLGIHLPLTSLASLSTMAAPVAKTLEKWLLLLQGRGHHQGTSIQREEI